MLLNQNLRQPIQPQPIQAIHRDELIDIGNGNVMKIPRGYEMPLDPNGQPFLNNNGIPIISLINNNSLVTNVNNHNTYGGVVNRHNTDIFSQEMMKLCNSLNGQGRLTEDEYMFLSENMHIFTDKYIQWVKVYPQSAINHQMQARIQIFDKVLAQYREQRNRNGMGSLISLVDFEIAVYDDQGNVLGNVTTEIFTEAGCAQNEFNNTGMLADPNLKQSINYGKDVPLLSTPEQQSNSTPYGYGNACKMIEPIKPDLLQTDELRYHNNINVQNPFKYSHVEEKEKEQFVPEVNEKTTVEYHDMLTFDKNDKLVGRIGQMATGMKDAFDKALEKTQNDDKPDKLSWDMAEEQVNDFERMHMEHIGEVENIDVFRVDVDYNPSNNNIDELLKQVPGFYNEIGECNDTKGYIVVSDTESVSCLHIPMQVVINHPNMDIPNEVFGSIWEKYVIKRGNEFFRHMAHPHGQPVADHVDDFIVFRNDHKEWIDKHDAHSRVYNMLNLIQTMPKNIITNPEEILISDIIASSSAIPWTLGNISDTASLNFESQEEGDDPVRQISESISEKHIFIKEPYTYINTNLMFEGMGKYEPFSVTEIQDGLAFAIKDAVQKAVPIIITFPRKPGCKKYNVTYTLDGRYEFIPVV